MHARTTLVLALAVVGGLAAGCSKSSAPTPPGGGGTGGGPTFDFHFASIGESHSQVFSTAGSFPYHCTVHGSSGMTGTVTVDNSSVNDSATVKVGSDGVSSAFSFTPSSVTIKPGGTVRWFRPAEASLSNHTATR